MNVPLYENAHTKMPLLTQLDNAVIQGRECRRISRTIDVGMRLQLRG